MKPIRPFLILPYSWVDWAPTKIYVEILTSVTVNGTLFAIVIADAIKSH